MPTIIDACGRACPEPVILVKKALANGENNYEVLVDNKTAMQNVTRFASKSGYTVELQQEGELYRLCLSRG